MNTIWIGLAGGALAFAHCLGMCGGFVLHLSRGAGRWTLLGRQLLWHSGKTFTYVFLGALAAFGGGALGRFSNPPWIQNILSYAAGGIIILMGLSFMGLLPFRAGRAKPPAEPPATRGSAGRLALPPQEDTLIPSFFRQFVREPTLASSFVLGIATGFLPCPIVLGFLALSAQSASVITGVSLMAAMGVGTIWSLLFLGIAGQLAMPRTRRWSAIAGGVLLVILGAVTIARGTELFHRVLGCPAESRSAATPHACCNGGN